MKSLIFAVGLAILVCVDAGGYIAKGGVIDFKKPLDYYQSAVQAGQMAWSEKLEDELSNSGQAEAERGAREAAPYVPTFFTSQTNLEALESTRREARHTKEYNFDGPLFYHEYHRKK